MNNNALNFNTETGIPVNLDGGDTPSFHIYPNDVTFIEKLTDLYKNATEYDEKATETRSKIGTDVDENGVPKDIAKYIQFMKDDFNFVLDEIDKLLGDGVSEKVFKGKFDEGLLDKFLDFLAENIEKNRNSTIDKYRKNREQRRSKKVM